MLTRNRILNLLVAPLIMAAAALVVIVLIRSKPTPPSRVPKPTVARVEIIESSPGSHRPDILSYGKVRSYYETRLASRVGGEIIALGEGFETGRAVARDQLLVRIDPADYQTAVSERESALATADQKLAEQKARSQLAREDWLATGRNLATATDFTLRKPQLAAAKADVAAAAAALKKARLDLERTEVRAPFDAIVGSREASPGNVVATGAVLGTLISRERAEVRLPLAPEQAALLDLPLAFQNSDAPALEAVLTTPTRPGHSWTARITRTEVGVDPRNQVTWVIAEIDHPFDHPDAFLPVGAFVDARIPATTIEGVHELPESAVIEDRFVWIVGPKNSLVRQPVERIFSRDGRILARIPQPAAPLPLRIVTRPLASFQPGQTVKPAGKAKGEEPSSNHPARSAP